MYVYIIGCGIFEVLGYLCSLLLHMKGRFSASTGLFPRYVRVCVGLITCIYVCACETVCCISVLCVYMVAQLVECSPSTQNVAGSNPARGSSFFLSRKKGVVFRHSCLLCLVSLNEFTCGMCMYIHVQFTMKNSHVHVHVQSCTVYALAGCRRTI